MTPNPPRPYRSTSYSSWPATPLRMARRIAMADGAELACFVYGPEEAALDELLADGPILALHGNGGTHATFAAVIDAVYAAGKAVIAPDCRAQGQSSRGSERLTYELMAADALAVLDALGVSAAHLLGHSDGAIEALLMARDHGDRVLSVVSGGANLTPEGVVEDPSWDTAGSAATNRAWAELMDAAELPADIDPTLLPQAEDVRLSAELLQLMIDEPHIEAASLSRISCPTCVLVGEHDCITEEETRTIASSIPGARLVVVPDVGHSLPRLAPAHVALQVLTNVLLAR